MGALGDLTATSRGYNNQGQAPQQGYRNNQAQKDPVADSHALPRQWQFYNLTPPAIFAPNIHRLNRNLKFSTRVPLCDVLWRLVAHRKTCGLLPAETLIFDFRISSA